MPCHGWKPAAALAAVIALSPAALAAQATDAAEAPPRTAWGDPDLQGAWDYSSITPMQRPERFGDRASLTREEAATLEQGAVARDRNAAEAPPRRAVAGENVGAYNLFWMDLGTRVVEDRRTSLIVDPPNGRGRPGPSCYCSCAARASSARAPLRTLTIAWLPSWQAYSQSCPAVTPREA